MKCRKCHVEMEYIPDKDKSLWELREEEKNYNFTFQPAFSGYCAPILPDGRKGFLLCPKCKDQWPHSWNQDGIPEDQGYD